MTAAITAAGVAVVGGAILQNQAKKAQEGAVNAQKKSISAATDVERERLQMEYDQYQEKMAEYRRKQAMSEKQMQQTIVNLAPYMQAGQGALYEMMALTGMAAPQGTQMPETVSAPAPAAGFMAGAPAPTAPTAPGRMGILSGGLQGLRGTMVTPGAQGTAEMPLSSPAAQEFSKGGLSLSSKRWEMAAPGSSPRKEAADMLAQVRTEMPTATPDQQQQEAINRLNAQYGGLQQAQAMGEARAMVPTVAPATSPYAGMTGAEAQQTAIQRVAESPLLQELMAQGETGMLQNAAATGGLRGGRTQAALAQFRPAMLQQEIDKLYGRLQGISGMGQSSILGAPTTQAGAAPTFSGQSQIPSLLTQAGAAQAGGILGQAQGQQNLWQNVGQAVGWGLEKYGQGGFFGGGTTPTTAAPTYGGLGIGNPSNY